MNLPLSRRRELLESLLTAPKDPLRLSPLLQAPSGQVLEAVRKLGLEGVVGKRIDSIYEPGERSGAWIKLRTNMEQEFVIGWLHPRRTRVRCVARGRLRKERAYLPPESVLASIRLVRLIAGAKLFEGLRTGYGALRDDINTLDETQKVEGFCE